MSSQRYVDLNKMVVNGQQPDVIEVNGEDVNTVYANGVMVYHSYSYFVLGESQLNGLDVLDTGEPPYFEFTLDRSQLDGGDVLAVEW